MTLLGLSSSLDKNDSAWVVIVLLDRPWKKDSAWVVIVPGQKWTQKGLCLGCHRPWTKMTLLGLSSSMDKNDSAWVVVVPGQK